MSGRLVVITDSNLPSANIEEELLTAAGFEVLRADCRAEQDVIDLAARADALIVQWAPITAAVIERLERCRFISRLGIGWDMIDLEAASKHGIAVANTPDYCIEEVAAHTLALALAVSRGLPGLEASLRRGEWSVAANAPVVVRPSAAVFAVIGLGRIGSRVAEIAAAVGFRVVVHDPYVPAEELERRGLRGVSLEEALAGAQVVSLHLPLNAATRHLVDAGALERMGEGSFLINTSRGGLVDEAALAEALHAGVIAGAALDVFEHEPLPEASPLRRAPNLLLTPHAAWYSVQALAALPVQAAQNVLDFFAGVGPASILNPDHGDALALAGAASQASEPPR
jgi:D-3-phosphoglycerate dehydrogenase / 2-oxoglutarate reductase